MKYLAFLLLTAGIMFANEPDTKPDISKAHKLKEDKKEQSKDKEYQAYLKALEEENKKLEDDGFCSCNNY